MSSRKKSVSRKKSGGRKGRGRPLTSAKATRRNKRLNEAARRKKHKDHLYELMTVREMLDRELGELAILGGLRHAQQDYDLQRARAAFFEGRYHDAAEIMESYAESFMDPAVTKDVMDTSARLHELESKRESKDGIKYYASDRGPTKHIRAEYKGVEISGQDLQIIAVHEIDADHIVAITLYEQYWKKYKVEVLYKREWDNRGTPSYIWEDMPGSGGESDNLTKAIGAYYKVIKSEEAKRSG